MSAFSGTKYPVVEIFDSIQGEGSWLGRPVTFIRLSGCNLKCWFCDTNFSDYDTLTVAEILPQIHYDRVVITGGEPLIHSLHPLLTAIKEMNSKCEVAIETNGTIGMPQQEEELIDWVVCSPKEGNQYKIHPLLHPNELKYVVTEDFNVENIAFNFEGPIWLQPEGSDMATSWKKCYNLAMSHPQLRVGVQLHKLMNVE